MSKNTPENALKRIENELKQLKNRQNKTQNTLISALEDLKKDQIALGNTLNDLRNFQQQTPPDTLERIPGPPPKNSDINHTPDRQTDDRPLPKALQPKKKPKKDSQFELAFGIHWLSRIGIIILLIGIIMALSYTYQSVGPVAKLLMGLATAVGLFAVGQKLEKPMPILAHALWGGGLSVGYMTLFAAFFIPAVQVVNAFGIGIGLLTLYALAMLLTGLKKNSQTMVLLSTGFAYFTTNYTQEFFPIFWLTLATTGVIITLTHLRPAWRWCYLAAIAGTFISFCHLNHVAEPLQDVWLGCYLSITAASIHASSVINWLKRPKRLGISAILHLNTWAFYILMLVLKLPVFTQNPGLLECLVAAVHFITLGILQSTVNPQDIRTPEEKPNDLLNATLWFHGVLFTGLGTIAYFEAKHYLSLITATQALGLGLLARRGIHPLLNRFLWPVFWLCSIVTSILMQPQIPLLAYGWLAVIAFLLESLVMKTHMVLRLPFLLIGSLYLYHGLDEAIPRNWMTVSTILTGCLGMVVGITANMKRYRITSLLWLALISGCYILSDVFTLSIPYRIVSFILLGLVLLGGSFGYHRLETSLNQKKDGVNNWPDKDTGHEETPDTPAPEEPVQ